MLTKRKRAILAISIITIVIAIVATYFILHNSPINFIEGKLKFNLPNESKIINYRQHGDFFKAKILIKKENISDLKDKLKNTIGSYPFDADDMPVTKDSVPWWDLDNHDIEGIYSNFFDENTGSGTVSHQLWAMISKNKDGQYYLYLSY